jgi:uncharacterized membrane protein YccC
MNNGNKSIAGNLFRSLFELKQTERLWHIPVLASLCSGIPLLAGLYFQNLSYGILACTAGLVILYLPSANLAQRMITMLACSFGFMISFTIGFVFSFHPILSAFVLGLFAFGVHWTATFFRMKPPGSFFFIMIASIASCMPFNLGTIPVKIGLVGMGAMLACLLAFLYSLYIVKRHPARTEPVYFKTKKYQNTITSAITGFFVGLSLLIGNLFHLSNPYWVPISCLAVMQGVTMEHIWQRGFHRILGTLVGLALTWLILLLQLNPLTVCIIIFVMQFIIEILVVRHYGLAVIFITPLTILLAEAGSAISADPNVLIPIRFFDIALGSVIGAIAGWFVHHEQLRERAERQLRKTSIALTRRHNPGD